MEKRTPLNMQQKQVLLDKQRGLCALLTCRAPLTRGFEDDHILALVDGGTNALENRRLLCPRCHRAKSIGEHKQNSKVKRLKYGRTRKGPPMPGSRRSKFKKHVNGQVSER